MHFLRRSCSIYFMYNIKDFPQSFATYYFILSFAWIFCTLSWIYNILQSSFRELHSFLFFSFGQVPSMKRNTLIPSIIKFNTTSQNLYRSFFCSSKSLHLSNFFPICSLLLMLLQLINMIKTMSPCVSFFISLSNFIALQLAQKVTIFNFVTPWDTRNLIFLTGKSIAK